MAQYLDRGPAALVDAVRSFSRAFIFTTSLPPAIAAGALAAVRHLRGSEQERDQLWGNAQLMHRLLKEREIPFVSDNSHIVSVFVGDEKKCKQASELLLGRHGSYVQATNAPSVRAGEEILRVAPGAVHSSAAVREFVEVLDQIWEHVDIPRASTSIPSQVIG